MERHSDTPPPEMTLALSKPIRTRSPLTPAPAIADRRAEIEQWVRRWTRKKVNLSNPDFKFVGPRGNRSERDAVLSFAREPGKAQEKGAFQIESERKIQKTRDRRQAYYWLLGCMAFGVAIAAKEGGDLEAMVRAALLAPVFAVLLFGSPWLIYRALAWVWALFNND